MVTACKAESKNKEFWDKGRARAVVATDSGEGMMKLGQQIARIMTALTKAGQSGNPSSTLSSLWERGHERGHNGSSTPNHPNSHIGRSGPGQTTPAHSLLTGHGTGSQEMGSNGQSNQGTGTRREGTANRQDPNSLQCFRYQGWGHMVRECLTLGVSFKPVWENWGNAACPCQQKLPHASSRPCQFPPLI